MISREFRGKRPLYKKKCLKSLFPCVLQEDKYIPKSELERISNIYDDKVVDLLKKQNRAMLTTEKETISQWHYYGSKVTYFKVIDFFTSDDCDRVRVLTYNRTGYLVSIVERKKTSQ